MDDGPIESMDGTQVSGFKNISGLFGRVFEDGDLDGNDKADSAIMRDIDNDYGYTGKTMFDDVPISRAREKPLLLDQSTGMNKTLFNNSRSRLG